MSQKTLPDLIKERAEIKKRLNKLERDFAGIGDRIAEVDRESEEYFRAVDKRRHTLTDIGKEEDALIDIEADIEILSRAQYGE